MLRQEVFSFVRMFLSFSFQQMPAIIKYYKQKSTPNIIQNPPLFRVPSCLKSCSGLYLCISYSLEQDKLAQIVEEINLNISIVQRLCHIHEEKLVSNRIYMYGYFQLLQIQYYTNNQQLRPAMDLQGDMPPSELDQEDPFQQQQIQEQNAKNSKQNNFASNLIPRQYYKAKRTATRILNDYFAQIKKQLLSSPSKSPSTSSNAPLFSNPNGNSKSSLSSASPFPPKFHYSPSQIPLFFQSLCKLANLEYTPLSSISPQKSTLPQDFLLLYLPQRKKIMKYNTNIHNSNNGLPRQLELICEGQGQNQEYGQAKGKGIRLPDNGTPAAFGVNGYFFDGATWDQERMCYVPMEEGLKVNLISGHVTKLEDLTGYIPRIKCAIVKIKKGFLIIGGYAGWNKVLTKKCTLFQTKTQKFHQICNLNNFHNCPIATLHNNKIYLFSQTCLQLYSLQLDTWTALTLPARLSPLPFSFSLSISPTQILILGGKQSNQYSTSITLLNTQFNIVDNYINVMNIGVCSERGWGPIVCEGFVTMLSVVKGQGESESIGRLGGIQGRGGMNIGGAVQVGYVGMGGCFIGGVVQVK